MTTNNITLSTMSMQDAYYGINYDQGFYLNATCNFSLASAFFPTTSNTTTLNVNTLTLTQTQYAQGQSNVVTTNTFSYYYEYNNGSAPTIGTVGFDIINMTSTVVSGVYVMASPLSFSTSITGIQNVGKYFYRNPLLTMNLSFAGNTYNPLYNLNALYSYVSTSVTKDASNNYFIPGALVISSFNDTTSNFAATTFSVPGTSATSNISLGVTVNNAYATSATTTASYPVAVVFDQPSITFVNSLPSALATMTGSVTTGCRIWTGVPSYLNSTIYGYNNYSGNIYDNTQNITTGNYVNELQICNGAFRTQQNAVANGYGYRNYINYNPAKLSQPDYSVITSSGYRYATFCWKIQNGLNPSGKITVVIKSATGIQIQAVGLQTRALVSTDGTPIYVYGRFLDLGASGMNNTYPTISQFNTYLSSAWIDFNSIKDSGGGGIVCNSANYFIDTNNNTASGTPNQNPGFIYAGLDGSNNAWTSSSGDFTYTTGNPIIKSGAILNNNSYFFCTVGLPMNKSVSFGYVQANFF
jgi:hypothetical protein